ncbi:MFS transporter [Desertibaculum subflavum]|uniref:MFS transporter n=1 Tax=Desertibaculum subflavum TaxID=2268458 RepID=UPI000E66FFF9
MTDLPLTASETATARERPRVPWALVAACCLGSFAATSSGTTRAPFLLDMARDLDVSVPLIANLFAMTATAWGVASLVGGIGADRFGRRPFLLGGPIVLTLAMFGVARAGSYLEVVVWGTLGGACCGMFMGSMMAEVSDRTDDSQRGRALGWVMSGQSLTLILGVPLAAWLGASIGWRGVHLCVAALAITSVLGLAATTRARPLAAGGGQGGKPVAFRAAFTGPVLRLLSTVIAERICYGLAAVYFATFLIESYGITLSGVALPLALFAAGNILGTVAGGYLADRARNRLVTFAAAMIASAMAALALFGWQPDLATSVALGFLFMLLNAIGRPSLMAALAAVSSEVRGTVMGLMGTCASIGWVGAAALGGWMLVLGGFPGFGPLIAALALLGAGLAVLRR